MEDTLLHEIIVKEIIVLWSQLQIVARLSTLHV
jgi:hypothetical protein